MACEGIVGVDRLRVCFDAGIGVFAGIVRAVVGEAFGEGERQLAAGVYLAAEHVGHTCATHRSEIPRLDNGGHAVEPRHCIGVAGDIGYHHIGIDVDKSVDKAVLSERQVVVLAVGSLAVLKTVFVKASDVDDEVGIAGHCCCFVKERVGDILRDRHLEAVYGRAGHISCGEFHFVAVERLEGVERRNHILHLKFGRTAALIEHPGGIFADYKYVFVLVGLQGQYAVVLQKHYRLVAYGFGCGVVFGRGNASERLVGVHCRAEYEA